MRQGSYYQQPCLVISKYRLWDIHYVRRTQLLVGTLFYLPETFLHSLKVKVESQILLSLQVRKQSNTYNVINNNNNNNNTQPLLHS